jgi:hypothetical protein
VEDVQHHVLEGPEVEARGVAQQFGGVRELVALEAGAQECVSAAVDLGQRRGPGVADRDGGVAVGGRAGDAPAQGVLVGGVDVPVEHRVVLGAGASACDDGGGAGSPGALGVGGGRQFVPACEPGLGAGGDFRLDVVEVGLGVKDRRVADGLKAGGLGLGVLGGVEGQGAEPGECEAAGDCGAFEEWPPGEAARVESCHGASLRHAVRPGMSPRTEA